MGLLAPLFLAGLLAVAIPIIVHLVHRERKEPLAFPSLMFLRRVPFRSAKRQRIRYWLLFLLRTAALLLIAAAFARPWVKRETRLDAVSGGGKDVVVLVDRSYSMSARQVQDRAARAARDAVQQAGGEDRVALIAFGEQAELLARLDEPRTSAQAAVQNIKPGSDVTRFAPALKLAGSVLANSKGPAEIIVITDRQRTGWRNLEQVTVPPNTTIRVVDVSTPNLRNVAVTNVQLAHSTFAGRPRVVPSARLINRGEAEVTVPVALELGGRVQQSRNVKVAAKGTADVIFDAMFTGSTVGKVRIDSDDDVAADNVAYFTTETSGAPVVRVVSGSADASFYFENALAAGDAGAFAVHRANDRLSAADLQNTNVVVLMETALPTGEAGKALVEFVRQGGGLVIAGSVTRNAQALMPLDNATWITSESAPAALVSIDAAHPVFDAFRASSTQPFATARVTRHLRGEAVAGATVLARFDDGSPALIEHRFGRGRVLVWASSFTRGAGDVVLQPAFVPFVQQLVKHAASGAHLQKSFTVGNVIDVNTFAPADRDAVVLAPSRERVRIPASNKSRTLRIAEAGIYQIRGAGENAVTQMVAANVDIAESDITPLDAALFNDAIAPRAETPPIATAELLPQDREQRQNFWWYLLLIAFAFLAIETLLANRISTAWRT